jgi:uncharacterized membrane protein YqjE
MATDTEVHTQTEPSLSSLVQGIVHDVQELTRQQLELLKVELRNDFAKSRDAGLSLIVGMVVAFVGGLLLTTGLTLLLWWSIEGLALWGAFLIVGLLVTAGGGGAVYYGYHKFQTFNPLPDQSVDALKENLTWATKK